MTEEIKLKEGKGADSALNKLKDAARKTKQTELDASVKEAQDAFIIFRKAIDKVKRIEKEFGSVDQDMNDLKRFL